ncbi:hypothetical protein C2U36_24205 [Escherichia coli]|nr:hypothetical protein C2U36_24205 [Escherichia coli]
MLARIVKPSVLDIPHWGKSWLHPSHLRTDNATLRWLAKCKIARWPNPLIISKTCNAGNRGSKPKLLIVSKTPIGGCRESKTNPLILPQSSI